MRPTHLLSFGFMLIRIFSRVFSAKPQMFVPQGSITTLPLPPSVAHRPSGEFGSAAAAGAGWPAAGATATVVAAGAGEATGAAGAGGAAFEVTGAAGICTAAGGASGAGAAATGAAVTR